MTHPDVSLALPPRAEVWRTAEILLLQQSKDVRAAPPGAPPPPSRVVRAFSVGSKATRRYARDTMLMLRVVVSAVLVASLGCQSQPLNAVDAVAGGGGISGAAPGNFAGAADSPSGGAGAAAQPDAVRPDALGDGSPGSASLVLVYRPQTKVKLSATALAWNRTVEAELWVTLRQLPSGRPCTDTDNTGCSALQGVAAVISDAIGEAPVGNIKEDGNSWHFMRRPTAIAWGDGELFSACGEALTDNYENDKVPYAGPALWSSNPEVFGVAPGAGQNGTHLDMLHETPYCMGLAHEAGNAYWAVNGLAGSLDRYDFHAPHQTGGSNHSDGEVYRYVTGELLREPDLPSHAAYDAERDLVYVADTGHGRVLSVNPKTARAGGPIDVYEDLLGSGERLGAEVVELIPKGVLAKPSGLTLAGDVLLVTDNASSTVYMLDTSGRTLRALDTQLPTGSLSGVAVGPDGKVYLTDLLTGDVWRVEPQ